MKERANPVMSISSTIRLYTFAVLAVASASAQVPVAPITQPHVTFVNTSGGPCAACTLATYAAGTTTPLATYVDAGGVSQNTNPIVLDAAGGANIWLGNNSYKFILKTALGTTIWTVDQVKGGGGIGGICGPAGTIQIANSGVNGLTCDSVISINTTNHTLNVGTLPANHVTIGALGTPTSWTFDTTTPATALASLGGSSNNTGTTNQLAFYAAAGNILSGTSSIPAGITAITQSPDDNSTAPATTAYVKTPGAINPTSIKVGTGVAMNDNQGTGTKVQHSTGSPAANNCAKFDATGNVVDAGVACSAGGTDFYFSFTGCTLAVGGNSTDCQGSQNFASVTPVVPTQPDANFYLSCNTLTGVAWGSSTGINSQSATGFQFAENVDRYNGIPSTVTPTVWCHLHHN